MKDFLAFVGIAVIVFGTAFLIGMLLGKIKDIIRRAKIKYRIKHRFDKPPTAKCYCVDCIHHDDETNRCWRFGATTKEYRTTADYWFCWEAEPRKE